MKLVRMHEPHRGYFQLGGDVGPAEQWHAFLKLCLIGGWKPAGAELARGKVNGMPNTLETLSKIFNLPVTDKCLSYLSIGARIDAPDARAMASAAENTLPDIPRETVAENKDRKSPLEYWSGLGPRITLEGLIEFLNEGGCNAMPDPEDAQWPA